jgi:hypothetical protein
MQPYLFPYLGYFQLINAADTFVIYDDVQYIRRGWMNRNRILLNGRDWTFTFSVKKHRRAELVRNIRFADTFGREVADFFKTLKVAYGKAPFFAEVTRILEDVLPVAETSFNAVVSTSLRKFCDAMGIATPLVHSSDIDYDRGLRGQARIMALAAALQADTYINPPGGTDLYDRGAFESAGIQLRFLAPHEVSYRQFGGAFVPNLSIIDGLMFNPRQDMATLLEAYALR